MEDYERIESCACCGEKFSLYAYNPSDYVYKLKKDGKTYWFCSYPCYRKGAKNERYFCRPDGTRSKRYNTI